MKEELFWECLAGPGIISVVGAGGKTTVVSQLANYGVCRHIPTMVSTTTKMGSLQVQLWEPYYGDDFLLGSAYVQKQIAEKRVGAWFRSLAGHKVVGLEPKTVDDLHREHPDWMIILEADGAKKKWFKAPKSHEPVIPSLTRMTIGVVNLRALGAPITEDVVHRIEAVCRIIDGAPGETIQPEHLVTLIEHEHGLFQYSRGHKVLVCTGYDQSDAILVKQFLTALQRVSLQYVLLVDGYRETFRIRQVLLWS